MRSSRIPVPRKAVRTRLAVLLTFCALLPLAAMPPRKARSAEAGAPAAPSGTSREAMARKVRAEMELRAKLRKAAEVKAEILACGYQGMLENCTPVHRAAVLKRVKESIIDTRVASEFMELKMQMVLAGRLEPGRRLEDICRAMLPLEAEYHQVFLDRIKAIDKEVRDHRAKAEQVAARMAGLPPGPERAALDRERVQAIEARNCAESLFHGLDAQARRQPWSRWRSSTGTLPPGIPPALAYALPPGLERPPVPTLDAMSAPTRSLMTRIELGLPIPTVLPGAVEPVLPSDRERKLEAKRLGTTMALRYAPETVTRSALRGKDALDGKLERARQVAEDGKKKARAAEAQRTERASREHAAQVLEQEQEALDRAERQARHAERLAKRALARELRRQERRAWEAAMREAGREAEVAAARQAEWDALEKREAEINAAQESLDRHEANQARRAQAEASPSAPSAPAPAAPEAEPAGPAITAVTWSRKAEKQRDKLDCDTDEAVEEALAMLLSDGIDRHNKRTKLLKSTRGRVVEIRLHAGRSACRLLYVETATPGEIEIVRVVPTSAENPAAFNAGLEAALKAAEANLPGRGQAGAGLPADPE